MSDELLEIMRLALQSDWMVFKVMIGVSAGLILADYFIRIGDKAKGMNFLDFIFVTIFIPVVLLTLTWPISKLAVFSLIGLPGGQ